MNFSEKLKEMRRNMGLSQEQLAEKIGVSRQAITKWETGRGLPDVGNIVTIAEIFNTTLDELIAQSDVKQKRETPVYMSETVYDIDCKKHFDINIGSAALVALSSGKDEKLHIKLSSETLDDLDSVFKVKLDERKNRLDVNFVNKNKLSRYEAEESLTVEIFLPEKYSDHCEISASVKLLSIKDLHLRRLEYDGDAETVIISDSSGSFELSAKTDYDITVGKITGRLDINQWKAKSIIRIPKENIVKVENKGRDCHIYYMKDGNPADYDVNVFNNNSDNIDGKNEISVSGMFSEVILDLTD